MTQQDYKFQVCYEKF